MRLPIVVRLFPWEDGSCSYEFYQLDTFIATGKGASLEQAEQRCVNLFGEQIERFEMVAGADDFARLAEESKKSEEDAEKVETPPADPPVLGGRRRRAQPAENATV